MRRRDLVAGLLVATMAANAFAQQSDKMRRIGYLSVSPKYPAGSNPIYDAFVDRLRELGYVEGENISIDWLSAGGYADRLPELASEMVRSNVNVIVCPNTQTTLAAKRATTTIPIVFCAASDPAETGLVNSLARPGGNVTGLSVNGGELSRKRLELLKEVLPTLSNVAVLVDPTNPAQAIWWRETVIAAQVLGLTLHRVEARTPEEIDTAFAAIDKAQVDALFAFTEPMFYNERQRIADLAARRKLPTANAIRGHAVAGDLMVYAPNCPDLYRRCADYVNKIMNGAKPADLPVEEPTKFELVINMKTANALGITIPPAVLLRADELIE